MILPANQLMGRFLICFQWSHNSLPQEDCRALTRLLCDCGICIAPSTASIRAQGADNTRPKPALDKADRSLMLRRVGTKGKLHDEKMINPIDQIRTHFHSESRVSPHLVLRRRSCLVLTNSRMQSQTHAGRLYSLVN
jgi:hypothetical protein